MRRRGTRGSGGGGAGCRIVSPAGSAWRARFFFSRESSMRASRFRAAEAEVFQPFRRRIVRAGSGARIDFENPLVCAVGIVSERMVREAAYRAILHSEIFAPKGALRIGKVPAAGPFPDIPDQIVYAIGADAPRITSYRSGLQRDVGARSEMGAEDRSGRKLSGGRQP